MATDQEIRDAGFKYIPQQKYLQNPYNLPIAPVPPPASGGITNTNAFMYGNDNGDNNFSPTGNAFGYGSPVSEVNVRTFNPQSNDPTGAVADAQATYRSTAPNLTSAPGYGTSFSGTNQDLIDRKAANEIIMDNRQNYGAGNTFNAAGERTGAGQFESPYDDSMDLGYQGTIGNKGRLNRIRNKVGDVGRFIGGLFPFPLNVATKLLPKQEDRGPGGGTYSIAGLSDAQKDQYNVLAKGDMLFNGQNGIKTLTGKNFTGKGYLEGQLDIYNKKGYDKYTTKKVPGVDEDDVYDANGKKLTGFLKKQYLEASAMYKTTEKQKKEAEEQKKQEEATKTANDLRFKQEQDRLDGLVGTTVIDRNTGTSSIVQNESGGNDPGTSRRSDHAQAAGLGSNAGNVRSANRAGTGSAQSYNQNLARGGRAGYFFGGRVNFRGGGMDASSDDFSTSTSAPGPGDTGGEGGNNPSDGSDSQFGGGNNDGGANDNPPVTVVNNNPVDISTVTKSVGDYDIPVGLKALMANKGKLQAVLNADNVLDKNLGAEFTYDKGPFSIGAYADMDGDKSLNANYNRNNSNYSFDLNDGGGQFKFTRTFANGGLASIL